MSKENGNNNDELVFNPGETISGFKLIKKIDEGGFGQVFKVSRNNKYYAMKIESNSQEGGSAIKLEINVLRQLDGSFVFPRYETGGRRLRYHYLVLELLGDNLKMLKARSPNPDMWSDGTWSRIGIQCLYALKVMHDKGFVHRDVKPSNFAVGLYFSRKIMLFDFGLARKFVKKSDKTAKTARTMNKTKSDTKNARTTATEAQTATNKAKQRSRKKLDLPNKKAVNDLNVRFRHPIAPPPPKGAKKGEVTVDDEAKGGSVPSEKDRADHVFRIARPHTDFRGTHQYASPNAHRQIELGRQDDIWSLMYMIAEMFLELPWTNNEDIPVEDLKAQSPMLRLFCDPRTPNRITMAMREKLEEIEKMLEKCNYYSHPDYDLVHKFLVSVMMKARVSWETPYDWETMERNDELSMALKKSKKEKRPWENPDNFFKTDKWCKLQTPLFSPNPSTKKSPAPITNKSSKPPTRNNIRNERRGLALSKEDSQAGDDELPLTPNGKSKKDGPGAAKLQLVKSMEPQAKQ